MCTQVSASFINKLGKWRVKCSVGSVRHFHSWQIQCISWKLRLNLCSLEWLNPSLRLLITPWTQEVNSTYIRRLEDVQDVFWTSYVLLIYVRCPGGTSMTIWQLRNAGFKRWQALNFSRGGSKLFHSIMVDCKKESLKKLWFMFRRERLCIFQVE